MPQYKWGTPYEWLMEKAAKWNERQLFHEFAALAGQLDSDQIQDFYQGDMDLDGYFEPLEDEGRRPKIDKSTNLRLTGEPLTAEDLKRIAECK